MNNMKPNVFASKVGVSVKTLQRWDKEGNLKANRTPSGRRFYTEEQLWFFQRNGENQNNVFNNLAISKKTDENFKEGYIYQCSNAYNGHIDVLSLKQESITVDLDNEDFSFILNPNQSIKNILGNNKTIFTYDGSIVK